jgi:hypothetical protein
MDDMSATDPISTMMGLAQQKMSNPMASSVPQPLQAPAQNEHPLVTLIKSLASGMQAYGWTDQPPQQRMEAQNLEAQKAETMARLAQTGAYQQGELGYRQQMAETAAERAKSYGEDVQRKTEQGETALQIKQQMADLAQEKSNWQKDMAQGRLDQAKTRISNQAAQFEKTFKLRAQQVGIEQAKLELAEQGMGIKQGFLDLAHTALSQKGTAEGLNTITKLQGLAYEHPILSQVFGLDDVTKAVSESRGAGIPGVGGTPTPTVGAPQTAPIQTPAPNKIAAKRNQRQPQGGGVTHIFVPGQGIQPVQGQNP